MWTPNSLSNDPRLTDLQVCLLNLLETCGPSSSRDLADYAVGTNARGVSLSLQYLRSLGVVTDGTVEYEWPASVGVSGCTHRAPGPIIWSLGEHRTVQGECPFSSQGAS